jgi:hypothetical protein
MGEKSERGLAPLGRRARFPQLDWFDQLDPFGKSSRMRSLLGEVFGEGRPSPRAFAPAVDIADVI